MKNPKVISILIMLTLFPNHQVAADNYTEMRQLMLEEINDMVQVTSTYLGKDRLDNRVMAAMATVPRHEFVPPAMKTYAYINRPLPIGHDQTISQPYIVALMTDLASVDQNSIVLEIGTGSGYQAAVLAEIARQVYTIEIVEPLGIRAEGDLERLGYKNISVRIGNGFHGWPEHAPYDAILVTAAPQEVPEPLLDQLKPGGKLVIPLGAQYENQMLVVIEKDMQGNLKQKEILPVGFVPLTGDH